METIAFYSYKGGVGRSLLVANAARFLGMLGKRVVALDLDIEAPGLHYKLGRPPDPDGKSAMTGGAVITVSELDVARSKFLKELRRAEPEYVPAAERKETGGVKLVGSSGMEAKP